MKFRSVISLAIVTLTPAFGGAIVPSNVAAEETSSDQWEDRRIAIDFYTGLFGHFGAMGGALEYAPIPEIAIAVGAGRSLWGARYGFVIRARARRRGLNAVSPELGISVGPQKAECTELFGCESSEEELNRATWHGWAWPTNS